MDGNCHSDNSAWGDDLRDITSKTYLISSAGIELKFVCSEPEKELKLKRCVSLWLKNISVSLAAHSTAEHDLWFGVDYLRTRWWNGLTRTDTVFFLLEVVLVYALFFFLPFMSFKRCRGENLFSTSFGFNSYEIHFPYCRIKQNCYNQMEIACESLPMILWVY